MIMTMMSVLSLLKTMEQLNEITPPVVQAGPVGKEIVAVQELRSRVGAKLWNDQAKADSAMLRWLRAKKMNVEEAERMVVAHLKWRKELDIDKLRYLEPEPKMLERFWWNMTGIARNGNPIMLMPFGEWDIRKYVDDGGTRAKFDIHQGQMWEKALFAVEIAEKSLKKARKDGSPIQYIMICDLNNFAYRQLASYTSLQFILSMVFNFENNYPEVIYYCYIINADWVFEMLLRIIRPLMTGSIEKLKVYAERQKWEKVVRKQVDPAILPYRYGGYSKKEKEKLKIM